MTSERTINWMNVVVIALMAMAGLVAAVSDSMNHRGDIVEGIGGATSLMVSLAPHPFQSSLMEATPSMEFNSTYNTVWTNSVDVVSILLILVLIVMISISIFYMRCCA